VSFPMFATVKKATQHPVAETGGHERRGAQARVAGVASSTKNQKRTPEPRSGDWGKSNVMKGGIAIGWTKGLPRERGKALQKGQSPRKKKNEAPKKWPSPRTEGRLKGTKKSEYRIMKGPIAGNSQSSPLAGNGRGPRENRSTKQGSILLSTVRKRRLPRHVEKDSGLRELRPWGR